MTKIRWIRDLFELDPDQTISKNCYNNKIIKLEVNILPNKRGKKEEKEDYKIKLEKLLMGLS